MSYRKQPSQKSSGAPAKAEPKSQKSSVTLVPTAKGTDTAALITNGADAFPEDSYAGSYMAAGTATGTTSVLEPTYKPGVLRYLCQHNNVLLQCIDVMEVNIDGTGHRILLREGATEKEPEKVILEDFFKEPFPGKSMVSVRREIRRDIEESGNGYMEAISSASGTLLMVNHLEAETMRLVRMDDPVQADKVLTRGGQEITVRINTRERRFVQQINGKKVYFKEFGASRELNRDTGEWSAPGARLPVEKRASEVIHFPLTKEAKTPYGSPRWINQMPSVLGSRKAEEFNLEFFDAGGLPPVLVMIMGGALDPDVKAQLVQHLAGSKTNKHRAAVVEATSSSGSLDSAGNVNIRVEKFGSDRMSDAMFQAYDKNSEEHVRVAFRLAPLFLGRSQDYNFATAMTAYMVVETQVFAPERFEFDEIINNTLVKRLGVKSYRFESLPMTLTNIENQLKAIEMVSGKLVDGEEVVSLLNSITGLSMTYSKQEAPLPPTPPVQVAPVGPQAQGEDLDEGQGRVPGEEDDEPIKKADMEHMTYLLKLASDWFSVIGLSDGPTAMPLEEVKSRVSSLKGNDLVQFNEILATKSLQGATANLTTLSALCGCGGKLMQLGE